MNKHQFMDHLTEVSNQESNMCKSIDETVTYFSLALQRAAPFNKVHNSVRPSQKGVNKQKPGMTGIVIHCTG